jgi:acyl-coenzyme A thioesterase PaaI-like protein
VSDEVDLELMNAGFGEYIPYNKALGLVIVSASRSPAVVTSRLAWRPELVGNPDTGVLHGGVLTAAIDGTMGSTVFLHLEQPVPIATLDLRVDLLTPGRPHRDIFVRATCVRTTHNVGFAQAIAFQDDPAQPIATAAGTFMLSTRGQLNLGSGAPR